MTDRRPGPPLFELLNKDRPDPDDGQGSKRDHTPHSKPAPSEQSPPPSTSPASSSTAPRTTQPPVISAGVSRAERSAATMPEEPTPSEGGIHLSTSRLYLSIALIACAILLVWAAAYKAGVNEGKQQMDPFITNKPLVLPPNTLPNSSSTTPSNTSATNPQSNPSNAVTQPPRVPARPAQAVMTAQGYIETDPRVPGNNYLQLATLPADQAEDAVVFMNDHNMPIIAVPVVDKSVRAGNNPSRYTLYSIGLAVPGGSQFRAMEAQRTQHVRAIAQLGEQWQRERRGGSDFAESKTQWVKYD